MANYKRRRPRTSCSKGKSKGFWLAHWPRWWDIVFHTRPRRRRDKATMRAVLGDHIDPDAATYSVSKKPHHYYW